MPASLLIALTLGLRAQAAETPADARIAAIRDLSARIEAGAPKVWREVTFTPPGESHEGAQATAWCHGRQLQKVSAQWMGMLGRLERTYLYEDGVLAFGFNDEVAYKEPYVTEGETHAQTRVYFAGPRIVRVLTPVKTTVDAPTGDLLKLARDLQAEGQRFGADSAICALQSTR